MKFSNLLMKLSSVSILTSILTLLTSFILAKVMQVEDFGEYSFYQSILMLLINIVPFGTPLAIAVFVNTGTNKKVSKILDNTLFILIPSAFGTMVAMLVLYSAFTERLELVYLIIIINSVFMSINILFISYLRTTQQVKRYAIHFFIYTCCITIAGLVGYVFYSQVITFYLAILLFLLIPTFISIKHLHTDFKIGSYIRNKKVFFTWSIKYVTPIVASTSVMSFLVVGDKIILGFLASNSVVASYAIAALLASTSLFVVNNFAAAWSSYLFKKLSKLSSKEIYSYYGKQKYKPLFALPLLFISYLPQLFAYKIFFASRYPKLELTILLLNTAYTLLGISKYFMGYLNYFGKNVFIFYSAIVACFTLIITSKYTYSIELYGLSISVLLAFATLLLLIVYFTNKVLLNNVNK